MVDNGTLVQCLVSSCHSHTPSDGNMSASLAGARSSNGFSPEPEFTSRPT